VRWRRERRRAPLFLLLAGVVAGLLVPSWSGADPAQQVAALRARQNGLSARSHAALLSLYSLDSELAQARARIASFQTEASALRVQQVQTTHEQAIAQDAWRTSVDALAAHLRAMYEQGSPDAISILLGASSVDDAMTRLDALERTARVDRQTIEQARSAQRTLARLRTELALRAQRVQQLLVQAEQTTTTLAQTRAQRVAYIASLARERTFNANQISTLEASAKQIAARSQALAPVVTQTPAAPTVTPTDVATSVRQVTVSATGYSLSGTTANGMPVGWGVVAVDPSVIPLGTRMSIPGYGEGVAADTGGAVHGATIDLWFPTLGQALAWGRRTVTITLH
jgi:3D (Asp-Asp-Asp) domain-containing protein